MRNALAASPASAQAFAVHVRRETGRFLEVAARSPLQAHVPAYPAFTVETLSAHIGRALRTFHAILSGDQDEVIQAPAGTEVIEWAMAGLDSFLTVLGEVPPDKLVALPHVVGDRPVGLIAPLLAVEIGVHRWDVESVLGEHAPIPKDLAIREIDSVFENFVPRLASTGVAPIGGIVRLQATDVSVAWSIRVDDGRLRAGRLPSRPEGADVVVTAAVEDLALIVWKRWLPPRPEVEVSGSVDVLKRFLSTDYIPDPRTTPAH
ncbi:MAG TPA: maleylpyruvate isomerase N-terminal domain-containing protein [Streptosporangiaceae bacterium]|jgi:uncharacterized protein (TIGR03083 family)